MWYCMCMAVISEKFVIDTKGSNDILNITPHVQKIVEKHKIKDGFIHVFAAGSTVSLTTMEFEPGLIKDLPNSIEIIAPKDKEYYHNLKWNDGNGHSHVSSAILGTSVGVPLINNVMELGTWQQIILIDFDNRPRSRRIIVQIVY